MSFRETSVEEALTHLQNVMAIKYMRSNLIVNLEPDAFYRLHNELHDKQAMAQITEGVYFSNEITIQGPHGPIVIRKDPTLGEDTYTRVWQEG